MNCEIWNYINELFVLGYIKIHSLFCALNGPFTHASLCFMLWSFGKYWSSELCRSTKHWHILIFNVKKSHLLISSLISSENTFKLCETVNLTVADINLKNSSICLKAQIFIIGKIVLFSLKGQTHLCYFWENTCKNLNNHSLSIDVFSKWCSVRKGDTQLAAQTIL